MMSLYIPNFGVESKQISNARVRKQSSTSDILHSILYFRQVFQIVRTKVHSSPIQEVTRPVRRVTFFEPNRVHVERLPRLESARANLADTHCGDTITLRSH